MSDSPVALSMDQDKEYVLYNANKDILEKIKELLDKIATKNISTLSYYGNRMSNSLVFRDKSSLGPLYYRSLTKLTPPQIRIPWNVSTEGSRIDSLSGIGIEFQNFSLDIARRTTYFATGEIAKAERQKVGYVTMRILRLRMQYYNDHYFIFFPMGGGTDQGDTAGFNIYWLQKDIFKIFNLSIDQLGFGLKLATGIPNQNYDKIKKINGRKVYSEVELNEIVMGTLYASLRLRHNSGVKFELQLGIDSSEVGDFFQNRMIHRPLNIPEFEKPNYIRPYISFGISIPFNL